MNPIRKAILFYKKEGFRNTLIRISEKIWEIVSHLPGIIKEKIFLSQYIHQIEEKAAEKNVYILIPCIDWNIPIFQRPHQIAVSLAKQPNTHVFFVSDEYRYDNFSGLSSVNPHLDLLSWRIVKRMGSALKAAKQVTVFMSWLRHAQLLEYIPYSKLVYEYIDDLSLFYYYTDAMKAKHYELIREADLTVCTAQALYKDALSLAKKVLLSPNAGDYEFFHENRSCPVEPSLREKTKNYQCVLGYYGCLASWFDYDLIIEVAAQKKEWCFVLVGYCFDGTMSRLQEASLDNIILYPAQPYKSLPAFASVFDIQTIPFLINEITKATSPVKLFEYMAMGKPILTSAMPECLRYNSVTTYQDTQDFIRNVYRLLSLRDDAAYRNTMEAEAKANTWDSRVTEILKALNGVTKNEKEQVESNERIRHTAGGYQNVSAGEGTAKAP